MSGSAPVPRISPFPALALALLTVTVLGIPVTADAVAIRISTGNDDPAKGLARGQADPSVTWNYTGDVNDPRFLAYVDNDPAFPGATTLGACHFVTGNCRTNNNSQYGPDVTGGYPAYLGVQFFYLTFDLPVDAIDVGLDVTVVGADDRVGFGLNGHDIAFWGNVDGGGTGRMDGSDKYAATLGPGVEPTRPSPTVTFLDPFPFTPPFSPFELTDPSLFVFGGTNVVRLWVNNTGTRNLSAVANPMSSGNPSVVGFDATLRFETAAAPEPATLALLGLGLAGIGWSRRKSAR